MVPTIILGMCALFGFLEQSDVPSIAVMILSSKQVSDKVDDGIMKEALLDFYTSSGKRKPDQIIIFRDGGSPDNVLHGTVIDKKLHNWGQFMKIRDDSETSSSHGGMYAPGVISVPQLFRLKDKVSNFILVY
ncbi:Protein argonaute 4 -like protein [Gossypium arboreum]|uniref:Protein argonaute 4-like protein n=1 Tax=Gossypium arboreum TaxID=29729 RepID=A0A0B0PRK1_GOSAR|nr:Protein argonaute 4 -like protein [Gossypium arboreum]